VADVFNVTGAVTPANPKTGDAIKVTITGSDTNTNSGTLGPLALTVTASNGATTTVNVASVPCTVVTTQQVKITAVTDPDGRVWTIASDGKSASSVA
jgi:hypothetical protein